MSRCGSSPLTCHTPGCCSFSAFCRGRGGYGGGATTCVSSRFFPVLEQDRNAVDAVATERKRNWQGVRPECGAGEQSGKKSKQKQLFAGTAWHTHTPPACCVLPPLHGSSGAIGTPTNLGLGRNSPAVTGFLSPVQGYSEFLVPRLFLSQASHRSLLAKNDD